MSSYECIRHKCIIDRHFALLCSCLLVLLSPCALSWAQDPLPRRTNSLLTGLDSDRLFSPSVGQRFYEIAYELANAEALTDPQAKQAIIFLAATKTLDARANYVLPDMIKLASRYSDQDYSGLVYQLLVDYVDESADLEVVREAVRYLLDRLDSREQREELLNGLLKNLSGKSAFLDSELETSLGLLLAEKADSKDALFYLMQAYNHNKYNKLAFAKLAELVGEQIKPVVRLEQLRLVLGENPLDIEAALAFAQYAEELQLYQTAADAYEYSADLFRFLTGDAGIEALPASIYLPWALTSYNTQRSQHTCLQIASSFRQTGRFDLLLEAIAAKAAAKIGDYQQSKQIFQAAEEKALQLVVGDLSLGDYEPQAANYEQLAWFYCFASSDADKAIDWANKAYSIEPNSATAAAILAYSLVMNQQTEWARTLIDNYEHNQIADLTLAKIQLNQDQQAEAIETLKTAIARDPGSLEAEHAKELLALQDSDYIPPTDPDIILTVLKNNFGQTVVPQFTKPENIISVQLNLRGSKFSYGNKFNASVIITNNSSEPLVISEEGLFNGNIRVDANISGDLNMNIPKLVSVKIRPALPIKPGKDKLIPLRLVTGRLRRLLLTHPQASLDIEFTVYLDPVIDDEGRITNRLEDIKPVRVLVKRPGTKLTAKYLRYRLNSLSGGRQGQKINTIHLFTGLLREQNAMANRQQPPYKFLYADWMPDMLRPALVYNLADDDWVIKIHTMAAMLSLPLDYELIRAVAENLNDTHWPARLMAVYLLSKSQDDSFGKVLDYTAKYDPSMFVRDMTIALGAAKPEQPKQPEPTTPDSEEQPPDNEE